MAKYIVSADWHLRDDRPLCRKDIDWLGQQEDDLTFIVKEANKRDAELIIAGDVYDVPRVSPSVSNMLVRVLSKAIVPIHIIAGNHSLQYHNQENLMNSSIGALSLLENLGIRYYECVDNSEDGIFEHAVQISDDITIIHTLTFPNKDSVPFGAKAQAPEDLFKKYPTKYLITGDYHRNFLASENDRLLINPGCINIQTADMLDYQPVIYYLDTDTGFVNVISIPINREVLTDNHLTEKKERDNRITSFIETVKKHGMISLSFEDNLRKAITLNNVDSNVVSIIEEIDNE